MVYISLSPDGEMLCSQGGAPNYLLTVWNWKASKKILCCQSCANDVYKSAFSTSVPDHIITCGMTVIFTVSYVETAYYMERGLQLYIAFRITGFLNFFHHMVS
jgi:hypothetical protein